ncbi:MAG: bifunctional enoyl-CoA hydratase/phosphate acetyltransferase [Anaerolineae bacterium]|jgi:phosphate butyryltransferase|nr:bifunctional enoyl-CoA hydratase/phosphate acetyltransferase [Anaerolineae bacterium]MDH7474026.1 bifunctional enoyl-CoA hydratase/phosphate acetyltransferase [Anaerolineae bacterium]
MIRTFSELVQAAQNKGPRRVAIVAAHEAATLQAAHQARNQGLAECILLCDPARLEEVASEQRLTLNGFDIIAEPDPGQAAWRAVEMVNAGQAGLAMNGLAHPRYLIEAALDRERGLRVGKLLTDVSVFEIPDFGRLLLISDIALVVSPGLEERVAIVQNAIDVAHRLGITEPKVAILAAAETVNPKVPLSRDAADLSKMAERGQIKGGIVDGPLGFDNAISPESAAIKGIRSPVAGRADILIAPDMEAGNLLARTLVCFARAKMASVIVGGKCPLVMPSRTDPAETKFVSLALGVLVA